MELADTVVGLVTAVVALVTYFYNDIKKARTGPERLGAVLSMARTVTVAAEQLGQDVGVRGPEKYQYAEQALTSMAKRVGLRLKPEEANAFIHAVLGELAAYKVEDLPAPQADVAEGVVWE